MACGFWSRMNTPSFGKFSPRWLAGKRGLIVTLLAGLAGWNLVMLAPDGGLPSLLVAYRWPVTIGLGAVLASALLALRQAARARRKR